MKVFSLASSKRPNRRRKLAATVAPVADDHRITLARHLDRGADALLFLGNHLAAERLSMRAQMLREVEASA